MSRKNYKGQINSIDATLAIVLFVIMLVFLTVLWFNGVLASKNTTDKNRLQYRAISISDALVKSQGLPTTWTSSNAQMLGFAKLPNVLSDSNVSAFTSLPYGTAKDLLNLDSEEFYFYIEHLNGTIIYTSGNSSLGADKIVSITRFVILNGTKVKMGLSVYE